MKKRNILLLCLAFALCAAVGLIGLFVEDVPLSSGDASLSLGTIPDGADENTNYVVVTVNNVSYEPYPLLSDETFTLTQDNGMENTLHISKDYVEMASANCDNQDCIHQGAVTADNKDFRSLGNKIICLPNQVVLSFYTASELDGLLNSPQS